MAFRPDPKPAPKIKKPKGGKRGYMPLLVLLVALIAVASATSAIYQPRAEKPSPADAVRPPKFDPQKPPRLGKPFAKARMVPAGLDPNHVECWFYVGKGKGWVAQVCYAK